MGTDSGDLRLDPTDEVHLIWDPIRVICQNNTAAVRQFFRVRVSGFKSNCAPLSVKGNKEVWTFDAKGFVSIKGVVRDVHTIHAQLVGVNQ